jgi:CheY-like chemotaxis protein
MHDQPPRRVLLAEDDALLAQTVLDFLSDEGFSVVMAGDGQQALEQAKTVVFDVLLTDLRMPHVDGIQLVRGLRTKRPALPVVVMSGNAPVNLRTSIVREGEGPLVIVAKPVRLPHLLQAIEQVLTPAAE